MVRSIIRIGVRGCWAYTSPSVSDNRKLFDGNILEQRRREALKNLRNSFNGSTHLTKVYMNHICVGSGRISTIMSNCIINFSLFYPPSPHLSVRGIRFPSLFLSRDAAVHYLLPHKNTSSLESSVACIEMNEQVGKGKGNKQQERADESRTKEKASNVCKYFINQLSHLLSPVLVCPCFVRFFFSFHLCFSTLREHTNQGELILWGGEYLHSMWNGRENRAIPNWHDDVCTL